MIRVDFSSEGGLERLRMHLNEEEWSAVENGRVKPCIVKCVSIDRDLEVAAKD